LLGCSELTLVVVADAVVVDAVLCERATALTISPCALLPVGALCATALTIWPWLLGC
jgi:hypothetical protein